jgi:hypothetical protein
MEFAATQTKSTERGLLAHKRSIIETIIDQLKSISQIEHSRHCSPVNFLVNLVSLVDCVLRSTKETITSSRIRHSTNVVRNLKGLALEHIQ